MNVKFSARASMSSVISLCQGFGVPPIKLKTRARGLQIEAAPATHQKGSAATEIIFSLPVILLALG